VLADHGRWRRCRQKALQAGQRRIAGIFVVASDGVKRLGQQGRVGGEEGLPGGIVAAGRDDVAGVEHQIRGFLRHAVDELPVRGAEIAGVAVDEKVEPVAHVGQRSGWQNRNTGEEERNSHLP